MQDRSSPAQPVRDELADAIAAIRRRDWSDAETLMTRSAGDRGAEPRFWMLYADMARALGRPAVSQARRRAALVVDPAFGKAAESLAVQSHRQGENSLLLKWLPRVAILLPLAATSHFRLARILGLTDRRCPSAVDRARRAVVLEPGNPDAVLTRAMVERELKEAFNRPSLDRMLRVVCSNGSRARGILLDHSLRAGSPAEVRSNFDRMPPDADEQVVSRLLPPGGSVLDIGANMGQSALKFLRAGAGRVVCIEANPAMAALVRKNLEDAVTVFDVALSDHDGTSTLIVPRRLTGAASLDPDFNRYHVAAFGGAERVDVPVRRLDGLDIAPCDFWKIDVEGLELKVLLGAAGMLETHPPGWIMVEIMRAAGRQDDPLEAVSRALTASHPHRYEVLEGRDGTMRLADLPPDRPRTPTPKRGTVTPLFLFSKEPVPDHAR